MSLTMAQGMKRLGMPVWSAFFSVALIGLIATSCVLHRDALLRAVERRILAFTDSISSSMADRHLGVSGSYVSFP